MSVPLFPRGRFDVVSVRAPVVIFLQSNWTVGFIFAWFYFMGGRHDALHGNRRNNGPFWALASILVTVAVVQGLDGGWLLVIVGQLLLFVAITLWRLFADK